ncbi:glycosyltransferase family 4 protein [Armatimonas rosea]|uniref:Glycosyltransferase involved in cell wall biosynthesis n=1 Tax=Armatimonas rosea TaxID=685828 RepID=A0A7W9SRZ0_ARMRO|nr:glycosyltransferase family 4 protein [Armatimonas rosea]MBB6051621.1 glycosyltransferase involved in cell wall biosynthesis [Armatimonas rosea]
MKTLLLIPSYRKEKIAEAVAADKHPTMDYDALVAGLESRGTCAELYDYRALEADSDPLVALARKTLGKDIALAVAGWRRRKGYQALFTNGENIGIFLALLLRLSGKKRPKHVTIGHRLSTGKKKLFFGTLQLWREMDTIFVYATTQLAHGERVLGIPAERLRLIPFHADANFWRPLPEIAENEKQVSAAGLEWRDYPTLLAAAERLPETQFPLAAASPWSKHNNETEKRTMPANVSARRYEYGELRELYLSSGVVAVPLYENDFQAGITAILEAMACGKAVVTTRTEGQTDAILDGENGLYVPVGDPGAWEKTLTRLQSDPALRQKLGSNARRWIEKHASLERWVDNLCAAILSPPP